MKKKFSGLKQHTCITFSVCGLAIWVQLSWVLWFSLWERYSYLHLGAGGRNLLPESLTWFLAGRGCSRVVGLRDSVPCWLLAGHLPQFLAMSTSQQGSSHGSWFSLEQGSKRTREIKQVRSQNLSWKPIIFAVFRVLKAVQPTLKVRELTQRYKHQEAAWLEPSSKLPHGVITRGWLRQKQKCLIDKCLYPNIKEDVHVSNLLMLRVMLKGCGEGGSRLKNENQGPREKWETYYIKKVHAHKLEFLLNIKIFSKVRGHRTREME